MSGRRALLVVAILAALAGPVAGAHAQPADFVMAAAEPEAPGLTTLAAARKATRYAARRQGTVAVAVLDDDGRVRGLRMSQAFPSASVVKAMLMVATLRAARGRPLAAGERALLEPMIRWSANDAAFAIYARVGRAGLLAVAKAAKLRSFWVPALFDAQITAIDQARFFLRIDRLVPATHRTYARRLLSTIAPEQSWGIPAVSRGVGGVKTFFKGGWRGGLVHQVALLERDGRRLALAVLSSGVPSQVYAQETIREVASRVLRPATR
jgi:hypothetical protein